MGNVQWWQAVNVDKTRRATEEIQWQGRAAHLREQGILGPGDGPAEARAYDAEQQRAAAAQRRVADDAAADPKTMLLGGLAVVALFIVGQVIAQLADSSGWITFTGWGIAVTLICTIVATVGQASGADRHDRRVS